MTAQQHLPLLKFVAAGVAGVDLLAAARPPYPILWRLMVKGIVYHLKASHVNPQDYSKVLGVAVSINIEAGRRRQIIARVTWWLRVPPTSIQTWFHWELAAAATCRKC